MSIEVLRYFCQSFLDLYKKCSLNTHMYRLSIFLNRVFWCALSLSLPRMLREPKHSIKPAFLFLYSVSILASARYFLQNPLGIM